MKRPAHFQYAIDQAVKYKFIPKDINEYTGIYHLFMWETYGFPIELSREYTTKHWDVWSKRALLDLLCLWYVLKEEYAIIYSNT